MTENLIPFKAEHKTVIENGKEEKEQFHNKNTNLPNEGAGLGFQQRPQCNNQ